MFESLQDGLAGAFKTLRGRGTLSEANMREGLGLVEQSLLEADVSYSVVQEFMAKVSEKALGEKVLGSLKPGEQVIGIVHQELIDLLGPVDTSMHLKKGEVTIIMLCGLQGSGKTTTCGKLSRLLLQSNVKPMLVAADLQRPAAIEQLHVLGEQLGVTVYSETGATDPVKVCRDAVAKAKKEETQVVILDTAGRLAIDKELMDQLQQIDRRVQPDQVYLVVDGMTGQDAVNSADAFNKALELDGVILTKLDGDARGGALLSVKQVTGVPVKFIGTGEKLDALELFRPEGMAGRILGQGDILALVETAQQNFDLDQQKELEEELKKGNFTLEHFRQQLQQVAQPGLMQNMMGMLPGMGAMKEMLQQGDSDKEMRRMMGMIDAMTPAEKNNPKIIDQSRRQRIAMGSGVQPQDVNGLIKQFEPMATMMKQMAGASMSDKMKLAQQLQSGAMTGPGGQLAKQKQGTGKRLSAKEKAKKKKEREKLLKKKKKQK
jgi:signal recognition particle subunit SRP54